MSPTSGSAGAIDGAELSSRLGITVGMVVQERGYDDDSDDRVSVAVEEFLGEDLVDEDSDEVVDVVLLWFRDHDGDLVDALVDAITPLADDGVVWLLTPKRGRSGYVEPSDVAEAAPTAGLSQTSMATIGPDWAGTRLVTRRSKPDKR
ncbi:MAG: hypothetical protein JWM76_216 [Pseudonocardiales bacterium]|nr:hypothetical protein [Pseudonocardiales bacterium]